MNYLCRHTVSFLHCLTSVLKIVFGLSLVASLQGQISITPATREVGAGVVPYQVLVSSTTDWTVSTPATWVTFSRTSGSADGNLMITAAANTTGADRTATITLGTATHTLTQRAASVALQELWGFGRAQMGQLGDNILLQRLAPGPLTATDVQTVAAGTYYSLILKTDGSLWAAGDSSWGQFGDGKTTDRPVPVQILASGVRSVTAGASHSLIVKSDGSLWASGFNSSGQLGDGTTTDRFVLAQILANGVQSVAASTYHSLIVKTDGSLWTMGANSSGQLGDGTTTQRNTPVQILASGVRSVAARGSHSLIVKTDGSLWAMGANSSGQLGDGTTTQRNAQIGRAHV